MYNSIIMKRIQRCNSACCNNYFVVYKLVFPILHDPLNRTLVTLKNIAFT